MIPTCPLCGKETLGKFAPFCSKQCSLVDLGNWLGEKYRLPVEDAPPAEEVTDSEDFGKTLKNAR